MTRRLYHDDAYLRRFDAEVVATTRYKAAIAVVLDRTTSATCCASAGAAAN